MTRANFERWRVESDHDDEGERECQREREGLSLEVTGEEKENEKSNERGRESGNGSGGRVA